MSRFQPYERRESESFRAWHDRLLDCPLLKGEPMSLIAWLSGARVEELETSRYVRRIEREEASRTTAPPNTTPESTSDDEYF